MGVRYRGEFNSYANVAYKVDILDTAYSSTVNEFNVSDVIIRYDGSDRFDPIHTSTAKILFNVRTSADRSFIESIIAASTFRFSVNIYQKSTQLYWRGVIDTAEVVEEDKTYQVVELTAHDGIHYLKQESQLQYDIYGTTHTYGTFLDRILDCLNVIPNIADWGASDAFVETVVDWFEANHPSTSVDPLAQSRVYSKAFTEYENDDSAYNDVEISYYDQLVNILTHWGARMFMEDGMWKIHSVQAFRGSTKNFFRYTKGGASESTGTYDAAAQTLTHPDNGGSDFYRTAGSTIEYQPRVDKVINHYEHNGSANMLPPHEDYLGAGWYFQNNTITASDSDKWRVKIRGFIRMTNRYGSTDWGGYRRAISFRLTLTTSAGTYTLAKGTTDTSYSWVNNSGGQVYWITPYVNTATFPAGYQAVIPVNYEFETPTLPAGVQGGTISKGYFRIYHIGAWYNNNNTQITGTTPTTSTPDWDADPYDGAYANNVVVQWKSVETSIKFYDNGVGMIENTDYEADYGGYAGSGVFAENIEIEPPARFGEPVGNAWGGIQVYDGGAWVDSSGAWGVDTIAGSDKFGELVCLERIKGKHKPTPIWNMTLKDADLPFWKRYLFDSDVPGYFQMVRGEYILNQDLFRGELHRIQRDNNGTASQINYYDVDTIIDTIPNTPIDTSGMTAAVDLTDDMINNGDTVTSIDIGGDVGPGGIPAGSTFLVVNPVTGAKQLFTATADVAEGATSISVISTTATADFPRGSYIVIPPQDVARTTRGQNIGRINCGDSSTDYDWQSMLSTYPEGLVPMINGGDSSSTNQETIYGGKSA